MINSCPRCGQKNKGFMKLCGACKQQVALMGNLDAQKKNPIRPIEEPEDDE